MDYFKLSPNDTKADYWSNVTQAFINCEAINANSTQFIPENHLIPTGEKFSIKLRFLNSRKSLIDLSEFSHSHDQDKSSSLEPIIQKEKTQSAFKNLRHRSVNQANPTALRHKPANDCLSNSIASTNSSKKASFDLKTN